MEFKDQMVNIVHLDKFPERIVSLVPSQTELLVDLGLSEKIVGVTRYCVHPKGFKKEKVLIGGTKRFDFDKIEALSPDLIIGNKEENYKEGIEELQKKYPVWMSDIFDLKDALSMMEAIGEITNTSIKCSNIVQKVKKEFEKVSSVFCGKLVLYFIWRKPYMCVGENTFIDKMIESCGGVNICPKDRFPSFELEELKEIKPDVVLLSSEPYSFKEKHLPEFKEIFPDAIVQVVDGEMFSWYGSRLLYAPSYFNSLNHTK